MGSVPFCWMYFTSSRFSNTCLETGDSTGSSGTSLQTECVDRQVDLLYVLILNHSLEQIRAITQKFALQHLARGIDGVGVA